MKHPSMETLQDYFEASLEPSFVEKVGIHLEVCDRCSGILAEMAMVDQKFKTAGIPSLPNGLEESLFAAASPLLDIRKNRLQKKQEREQRIGELLENIRGLGEFIVYEAKSPAIQVASLSALVLILAQVQRFEEEKIQYKIIDNEVRSFNRAD